MKEVATPVNRDAGNHSQSSPVPKGHPTIWRGIAFGAVLSLFAVLGMFGCQAAQEPANATEVAKVAAPTSAKTQPAVPDSILLAAMSAFEKNKCGLCHSVGGYADLGTPTGKRDLSAVGKTRTAAWISGFLQKKETINGKPHMKAFAGIDAELAALSGWLAAQKTEPAAQKAGSTK